MPKDRKAYFKQYRKVHRDERINYMKQYNKSHRDELLASLKANKNSKDKPKHNIRTVSRKYLYKTLGFQKIDGYELHHCFTYEDYKQFIYIPKSLHLEIHQFLRDNEIDADSNHFEQIKPLLDSCKEKIFIIKDGKVTEYLKANSHRR